MFHLAELTILCVAMVLGVLHYERIKLPKGMVLVYSTVLMVAIIWFATETVNIVTYKGWFALYFLSIAVMMYLCTVMRYVLSKIWMDMTLKCLLGITFIGTVPVLLAGVATINGVHW